MRDVVQEGMERMSAEGVEEAAAGEMTFEVRGEMKRGGLHLHHREMMFRRLRLLLLRHQVVVGRDGMRKQEEGEVLMR